MQMPLSEQTLNVIKDHLQSTLQINPKQLSINSNSGAITLTLPYPAWVAEPKITEQLQQKLLALTGENIGITWQWQTQSHKLASDTVKGWKNVKNIIAVASGKGGVGKSMLSAALAIRLQSHGARVGLFDADLYGPSQPTQFGSQNDAPESKDKKSLEPIVRHGVQTMSIGYLLKDDTPVIWRGPMISNAMNQLMHDTQWQDLDYLIVDLPPGTGDIQLTLAKQMPLTAAIVITTPQDLSLIDARRAHAMLKKLSVPTLGIVENMSYFECPNCQTQSPVFDQGGGERMAKELKLPLLGKIPLLMSIGQAAQAGDLTTLFQNQPQFTNALDNIVLETAKSLSTMPRDLSHLLPDVVTENKEST